MTIKLKGQVEPFFENPAEAASGEEGRSSDE
jgi:hypothetical protein